ncbi:MAG: hypothetical protein HY074_07005 [Deltaproteobacteria bacterium]|nr:hypothetical protein [Deltaproteobacteria bacterium]
MFGDTALDPGQNLPAQILAALQAHFPKKDFEVINAGCNSYNSGHEALYLMSELVDFKPDLVIVYDGWNDMPVGVVDGGLRSAGRQNHIKSPEHYYFENRERASHSVWGAFKTLLDTVGDTIRVFAAKTWRDLTPVRPSPPADQERFSRGVPTEGASSQADLLRQLSNYREHLEIMLDLAVRHRFKIAFFLQPIMTVDGKRLTADENRILPYAHDATARKMYYLEARKMFQDLKRQASGSRLACVSDLSRVFAPVAASVYADTGHLLLHGEQIVAAEIVKRLDGCNLINE